MGYRQTIGARKERIRAANADIEKIVLKRIALDSYVPSIKEVNRMIETKARDYGVRPGDLHSETEVLGAVFTRFMETDFVTSGKRDEILRLMIPVFKEAEEEPAEESEAIHLASTTRLRYVRTSLSLVMAIIASLLGTLMVFFFEISRANEFMIWALLITAGLSFLVIAFLSYIYRFRESQEEKPAYSQLRASAQFERELAVTLTRLGIKTSVPEPNADYDFLVEFEDERILLDARAWSHVPPTGLRKLADQLSRAVKTERADKAIIVTRTKVEPPPRLLKDTSIEMMSIDEFRHYALDRLKRLFRS